MRARLPAYCHVPSDLGRNIERWFGNIPGLQLINWTRKELLMQGDAKVIEYLNRGLRSELAAINQYWLHYRLLENWGYNELAKQWRKESLEEMQHADKLVERIIFLDGFPNMQVICLLYTSPSPRD